MKHIKLFENFDTNTIDLICNQYKIENYTINSDGSIDVDGDVNILGHGLYKLPLKFGKVYGSFYCQFNKLTSLEGSPNYVGGDFLFFRNNITSLEGSPDFVGGDYSCSSNKITTLIGFRTEVVNKFRADQKNMLIYDILKDNLDDIPSFYEFNIITNLEDDKPTINLKRLNKFIKLYDLKEISEDFIYKLENYYNVI